MSRNAYRVFSEGKIANLNLKNRLVRSATYEAGMTGDGKVTDGMSALYKNLAEGGFQVVTFDYSGLGQSTGEKSYNPASLVQDARDLINGYKRLSNSLPGDQIDIDCS